MEEMVTAIHGINMRLDKLVAAMHPTGAANGTGHAPEPQVQHTPNPANDANAALGLTAAAPPPPPANQALSEDMLMALIEPHLDNVTIKTAFQGVLAQMGIPRLPEARADQYAALYSAFSNVIAQHTTTTGGTQRSII
jgi:hypothetical protein